MKRGLGRLLKKSREGFSIQPLIDSAVARSRPGFSFKAIFKKLLKMEKIILSDTDEDAKANALFEAFFDLQELVYAPPKRAEVSFHPSSLSDACERAIFYEFTHAPYEEPEISSITPRIQRIFDVGTWWHTYLQNALRHAGILEMAEAPVIDKERRINGKADGILKDIPVKEELKRVLLEIKTINSWGFSKLTGPLAHHEYQASIYADVLGLDYILFLYVQKDTCELKEYLVPKNKALVIEANEKISLILDSVNSGEPPSRICPSAVSKAASQCGYCKHCFKDA